MNRIERHHWRRGSVYVLVLGATMLVTVIGMTALLAVRIQHRTATSSADQIKARLYAQAGVEMGTFWIQDDPDWRTTRADAWWAVDMPFEDGTFSLQVTDPTDGDLSDSATDPIIMYCQGKKGEARHLMKVHLEAVTSQTLPPMEALSYAIHTGGGLAVQLAGVLTPNGAPASTNSLFSNSGTLAGDVEAVSESGLGLVTGTKTIPAPTKALPDATVFDQYVALATSLTYTSLMNVSVLAPNYNSFGSELDADGVYYINTGGGDLTIKDSRILGTLVIDTQGGTVIISSTTLMQPYRTDYPVLLVKGNLRFEYDSVVGQLDEKLLNVNYNPTGAPYLTVEDADKLDVYPSRIDGFVYCTGNLIVQTLSPYVNGTILCAGAAGVASNLVINYDPSVLASPPMGFTQASVASMTMRIDRGSWRQVVE